MLEKLKGLAQNFCPVTTPAAFFEWIQQLFVRKTMNIWSPTTQPTTVPQGFSKYENLNLYINLTTEQKPSAAEDHVKWLKALKQPVNEARGEIILSPAVSGVK